MQKMNKLFFNINYFLLILFLFSSCSVQKYNIKNISLKKNDLSKVENAPLRVKKEKFPVSGEVIVKATDTIYNIAMKYQVTPQSIVIQNNLKPPFILFDNQILKLLPNKTHEVNAKDTLFSISQRYAVSQFQIVQLNDLKEPYILKKGQILLVPDLNDFSVLESNNQYLQSKEIEKSNQIRKKTAKIVTNIKKKPSSVSIVVPDYSSSNFTWPLSGNIIKEFGPEKKGIHNDGVNISALLGTPVNTSAPGKVVYIGKNLKTFGTLVLVKHKNRIITAYAHLQDIKVKEGDDLNVGDQIGSVGTTGKVNIPQLHFEIRQNRTPKNPKEFIL